MMSQIVTKKGQNAQANLVVLIIGAMLPIVVRYRLWDRHLLTAMVEVDTYNKSI